MTLREQIKDIASRRVTDAFAHSVHFPIMVTFLASHAFIGEWAEGPDTRAIRRAANLLEKPGYVSDEEPSVT